MSARHDDARAGTGPAVDLTLPTIREILQLPEVTAGLPEVLAGEGHLDARVRWVHTSDSPGVARLLNGGELLMSTGSGWALEPDALREFIARLVGAGIAGLVLELGAHYRWAPTVIVEAARELDLPLVALHHEVKFVAITEAVHRGIIEAQTEALRARDEVRDRLTALALRGAPADFVVEQLSHILDAPVVLENLAHEVVAAQVPPTLEPEVFADWERRSRAARRESGGPADAQDWLVVPVEARGIRWGHLVALPGPEHPAGRLGVLQQGAIALALGRLAGGQVDEWERQARSRLVDELLAGRFASTTGAAARLSAAGLPVPGRRLHGLVVTRAKMRLDRVDAAARTLEGRAIASPAPAGVGPGATIVLLSLPPGSELTDAAVVEFVTAIASGSLERAVISVGPQGTGLEAALASLQEAISLARGRAHPSRGGPALRRADARPLIRLVSSLRDDHRLLEHGERMLAPLIEHDITRDGDLLDVLTAALAHPANRTAAAAAAHLSRSVFYQRLALIEQLLGLDLDDGETQTALHLALLARRSAGR